MLMYLEMEKFSIRLSIVYMWKAIVMSEERLSDTYFEGSIF